MKTQPLSPRMGHVAKDVMSTEAVPMKPGTFGRELVTQFLSGQYDGWPVVDQNRKVIGVLRESRLLQALSANTSLDDLQVEDIMTTPPVFVFENDPLELVLHLMVQQHVMRMPVVGDRHLAGVISRGEVLRLYFPSSSSPGRSVPPCVLCERIQGLMENESGHHAWMAMEHFLSSGHLKFTDLELAHTYCPSCLKALQSLLQKYAPPSEQDVHDPSSAPCLLVVDDDTVVAAMLGEALKGWGYDVCMAHHGREALQEIDARQVDGILLDLDMPVMNGRTMLDELRWKGYEIPVVMMSGGANRKELKQFLQEGAQGYLIKPFSLQALKQVSKQIFGKARVEEPYTHAS